MQLVSGVSPPPPKPVPPVYERLKDLHLQTWIVRDAEPRASIVIPHRPSYEAAAKQIVSAISRRTGVQVPLEHDSPVSAYLPLRTNLILAGNCSTNRVIQELYSRYYTLLDLRYPGPAGWVIRSLHNPFGTGFNVIFVGGSDDEGIKAGTAAFIKRIEAASRQGGRSLGIGWVADIQLGRGVSVPRRIEDYETWEASNRYGSVGYFGWNSISKHMAMYYMTGNPWNAREALRLAFPDKKTKEEIARIDGERIENKDDPLAGPYHYNAHMMVLFWDLIEESPAFTDEERLRVTNALARQLAHRVGERIYWLTGPARMVGSRHGQWAAIALYCLGRYFNKYYPNPIWEQCMRGAVNHFASLHHYAWVAGESDNLFWYNTGIAPILAFLILTGDRKPMENRVLHLKNP